MPYGSCLALGSAVNVRPSRGRAAGGYRAYVDSGYFGVNATEFSRKFLYCMRVLLFEMFVCIVHVHCPHSVCMGCGICAGVMC
jgi:hypothetical protein